MVIDPEAVITRALEKLVEQGALPAAVTFEPDLALWQLGIGSLSRLLLARELEAELGILLLLRVDQTLGEIAQRIAALGASEAALGEPG